MNNKQRGMSIFFIFVVSTVLISACTQSLSSSPTKAPAALPTGGLFVSPVPSAANPMAMIEEFAKQTSVAQTTVANGGTPLAPAVANGTAITPQTGDLTSMAVIGTPSTPTNALTNPNFTTPGGIITTPVPDGVRPSTYTLQKGEFPFCIARRFNVDINQLLSMSGLVSPDIYEVGLTLTIPQSGSFGGDRALASHPTTYTVSSSDETIYGVACKYGNVDPASIASANSLSVSASLTAGQQIQIP